MSVEERKFVTTLYFITIVAILMTTPLVKWSGCRVSYIAYNFRGVFGNILRDSKYNSRVYGLSDYARSK